MLAVYLLMKRKISVHMSSYQIFRLLLNYLGTLLFVFVFDDTLFIICVYSLYMFIHPFSYFFHNY